MAEKITKKEVDFSKWYNDVIIQAKLADYSPVKGCMIIRPNGYVLWERLREIFDKMLKETGHQNAYFPLFIPENFLKKEEEQFEGFAPQCAVVTHGGGKKLEENLMVRPTSETIMYSSFAKWINSYRDLPLLINQWANIVRWEMRTRLFLRTMEFLWQEGHTAHATAEEADEEALLALELYRKLAEDHLAIPVITGYKSDAEKFPGATATYCIEAMMGDTKSLQAGTSHNLGQNFSKPFNVRYQTQDGGLEYVWQTSWGISTRLIGALIMAHGDNNGLVIPPEMADTKAIIIPIYNSDEEKTQILEMCSKISEKLNTLIKTQIDDREQYKPGWKFSEWELLGIPVRIEMGPKDFKENSMVVFRRDTKQKEKVSVNNITDYVTGILKTIQQDMFLRAKKFREDNTYLIDDYDEFKNVIEDKGGFIRSHWCGSGNCEAKIQEETKATLRVIPFDVKKEKGKCLICGKDSANRVIFAKAY